MNRNTLATLFSLTRACPSAIPLVAVACIKLAAIGLISAGLAVQEAGAQQTTTLLDSSPFVPKDFVSRAERIKELKSRRAKRTNQNEIQLKGVYRKGDEWSLYLYDPSTRNGSWITDGEYNEYFEYRNFDPEERTLDVKINDQWKEISMSQPSDNPLPVVTAPKTDPTRTESTNSNVRSISRPTTVNRNIPTRNWPTSQSSISRRRAPSSVPAGLPPNAPPPPTSPPPTPPPSGPPPIPPPTSPPPGLPTDGPPIPSSAQR